MMKGTTAVAKQLTQAQRQNLRNPYHFLDEVPALDIEWAEFWDDDAPYEQETVETQETDRLLRKTAGKLG